jgi:HEAT repeat protein
MDFIRYLHTLDDTILGPDYRDDVVFRYGKVYLQDATIREALDAFARASQCRWIARIRTDGRIKITFKDKDTNEYSVVRGQAARALGYIGDRRAIEPLIAALKDKDPHVRNRAAGGLGNPAIEDARVVEPLIAALNDEFWRVRATAVVGLGGTKDPRAFELLIAALDDGHPNVRKRAAGTLGKIKDHKAVEPLIALLTDDNQAVRAAAAVALSEFEDSRAIEPLIAMVRKEDGEIPRVRGLKALEKLGHAGAAKAIRERRRHRSDEWWRENKEELLRNR